MILKNRFIQVWKVIKANNFNYTILYLDPFYGWIFGIAVTYLTKLSVISFFNIDEEKNNYIYYLR